MPVTVQMIPSSEISTSVKTYDVRNGVGAFYHPVAYTQQVAIASATQDTTTGIILPAGFVIEAIVIKAVTDATFATATHLSMGDGTDPDLFFEVAKASVDGKNDEYKYLFTTPQLMSAATTVHIESTNGSGAAAGTVTGTFDVLVTGRILGSLPNNA